MARNSRGAVFLEDLAVYPTGIAFDLRVVLRPRRAPTLEALERGARPREEGNFEGPPSLGASIVEDTPSDGWERPMNMTERAVLSVELEDGRRARSDAPVGGPGDFTILAFQEGRPVSPDPETNVILNSSGGSSGPEFMHAHYFLWPLPTASVAFIGSWEEVGLEEGSVTLSPDTLADGLSRARRVWD